MIKIKKSVFNELFLLSRPTWKTKFTEKFKNQIFSDELEFEESFLDEMERACDPNQPKQLETFKRIFKDYIKEDLFSIKTYSEVCKKLGIKELTEKDFKQFDNPVQMLAFHKIKNIEKLFNGNWEPDFSCSSQYKYYPYFEKVSSVWQCYSSYCYFTLFFGFSGLYKDSKTAEFVGKTFQEIYIDLI